MGEIDHGLVANHLGDLDGGYVEGLREGFAQGDGAGKVVLEVLRLILLAVEEKSGGLIDHDGGGGERGGAAGYSRVQGGGVNEGLEDGTRLALGQNPVQLAGAVIAAADQRFDFSGVRVERDESAPAAPRRARS